LNQVAEALRLPRGAHADTCSAHARLVRACCCARPCAIRIAGLRRVAAALRLVWRADAGAGAHEARLVGAWRRCSPLAGHVACLDAVPEALGLARDAYAGANAAHACLSHTSGGRSPHSLRRARLHAIARALKCARRARSGASAIHADAHTGDRRRPLTVRVTGLDAVVQTVGLAGSARPHASAAAACLVHARDRRAPRVRVGGASRHAVAIAFDCIRSALHAATIEANRRRIRAHRLALPHSRRVACLRGIAGALRLPLAANTDALSSDARLVIAIGRTRAAGLAGIRCVAVLTRWARMIGKQALNARHRCWIAEAIRRRAHVLRAT